MCKFRAVKSKTEGMAASVRVFFEHPSYLEILIGDPSIQTIDSSKFIVSNQTDESIIKGQLIHSIEDG